MFALSMKLWDRNVNNLIKGSAEDFSFNNFEGKSSSEEYITDL